jgi:hypothetical protein
VKTVANIIIATRGGLEALKDRYIKITNPPRWSVHNALPKAARQGRSIVPLVVEFVGNGPRGNALVAVAHTYVQEGDVMYDPEMEFEVSNDLSTWLPVSYRQDNLGTRQEAVWVTDRRVQIVPRLVRELSQFANGWDRNLRRQGFLAAAKGGDLTR